MFAIRASLIELFFNFNTTYCTILIIARHVVPISTFAHLLFLALNYLQNYSFYASNATSSYPFNVFFRLKGAFMRAFFRLRFAKGLTAAQLFQYFLPFCRKMVNCRLNTDCRLNIIGLSMSYHQTNTKIQAT